MATNIGTIAHALGAKVVGVVPDAGGGAFGAARLAQAVSQLRKDGYSSTVFDIPVTVALVQTVGRRRRDGESEPTSLAQTFVLSDEALAKLERLAAKASTSGRQVSPVEMAARLLERSLESTDEMTTGLKAG